MVWNSNPYDFSFVCFVLFVFGQILQSETCGRSRWVNVPVSAESAEAKTEAMFPVTTSHSSLSLVTQTGGPAQQGDRLTVSREEIVKGVVIKGIVCTPKNGRSSKKNKSTASLNPFEKRNAPQPPVIDSDFSQRNKNKARGGSKNWDCLVLLTSPFYYLF